MKRYCLYIIIVILALLARPDGTDVGKLEPVGLVAIRTERSKIVIETDTGNKGTGSTVVEAVQNLRETTAGVIFLDTADFLLVEEQGDALLEPISAYLKERVKVCTAGPEIDLVQAAEYLLAHPPATTLKDAQRGAKLPTLTIKKERYILG